MGFSIALNIHSLIGTLIPQGMVGRAHPTRTLLQQIRRSVWNYDQDGFFRSRY